MLHISKVIFYLFYKSMC